jgi:phosphoribosylpyrophosphate synthetase
VNDERFKIFTGTANPVLAESICRTDVPLGKAKLAASATANFFRILENVRGADVLWFSRAYQWTNTAELY